MSIPLYGILLERPLHSASVKLELIIRQKNLESVGFDYFVIGFDSDATGRVSGMVGEYALNPASLRNAIERGQVAQFKPGRPIDVSKPYWAVFFIRSTYDVLAELVDFSPEAVEIEYHRIRVGDEEEARYIIGADRHRLHLRDMSVLVRSGALRRMKAARVGSNANIADFSHETEPVYGDPSKSRDNFRPGLRYRLKALSTDRVNPVINDIGIKISIIWRLRLPIDEQEFKEWAARQFEFTYVGRSRGAITFRSTPFWDTLNPKIELDLIVGHGEIQMYYKREHLPNSDIDDAGFSIEVSSALIRRASTMDEGASALHEPIVPYYMSNRRSGDSTYHQPSLVFDFGTSTVVFAFIDPKRAASDESYNPLVIYSPDSMKKSGHDDRLVFDPQLVKGVLARSQIVLQVASGRMVAGPFPMSQDSSSDTEFSEIGCLSYAREFLKLTQVEARNYILTNEKKELIADSFVAISILKLINPAAAENYKIIRSSKTSLTRRADIDLVFGDKSYATTYISNFTWSEENGETRPSIEVDVTFHPSKKAFLISAIYQFIAECMSVDSLAGGRTVLTHPASMSRSVNRDYATAAEAIWLTQAVLNGWLRSRDDEPPNVKNDTITEARAVLSVVSELVEWTGQRRLVTIFDVGAGTFDASCFLLNWSRPATEGEEDPFEFITLVAQATGHAGDAFRDALFDDFRDEIKARGLNDLLETEFFKGGELREGPSAGLSFGQAVIEAIISNPLAWYIEEATPFNDTAIEELVGDGEIPLSDRGAVWLRVPMAGGPDNVERFLSEAPNRPPTFDDPLQRDVFKLGDGNEIPGVWFKVTGTHQRNATSASVAPRTQLLLRTAAEMAVQAVMTAALRRMRPANLGDGKDVRYPSEHIIVLSGRGALNPMLRRVLLDTVKATLAIASPLDGGARVKTRLGSIAGFVKARRARNPVIESWVRQLAGSPAPDVFDADLIGLLMKTAVVIGGGLPLALRTSGGDAAWDDGDFDQFVLLGRSAAGVWSLCRLDGANEGNPPAFQFRGQSVEALRPVSPMLNRIAAHPKLGRSTWTPVDEALLEDLLGDLMGCSISEGLDVLKASATIYGEAHWRADVQWTIRPIYDRTDAANMPTVQINMAEKEWAVWTLA